MLDDEFNPEKHFYCDEPLACDFETSSLKKSPQNALSLSLVICDDQLEPKDRPKLNLLFLHKPEDIQDVALAMNAHLFVARAIAKNKRPNTKESLEAMITEETFKSGLEILENYIPVEDWTEAKEKIDDFLNLYYGENEPTLLGKNIKSFDRGFFPELISSYFKEEVIDVGDYWRKDGEGKNPGTAECCRRAGISDHLEHDAYKDNLKAMQLWELGNAQNGGVNP